MILFSFLFISSVYSIREIFRRWTQNQQTDIDEEKVAETNSEDQGIENVAMFPSRETSSIQMPKPASPVVPIPSNSTAEGQQPSSGEANDDSVVLVLMPDHPSPPTDDDVHVHEVPDFKTEFKIATSLITISGGVIVALLAALIVLPEKEQPEITHKVIFKMFTSLNYISLVSGVFLFLLTLKRPDVSSLVTLVRVTMWISIVALTCALGFATCLINPKSVEVIPILVIPLALILFIMILVCCCCPRK